jgi:hypothetical protein
MFGEERARWRKGCALDGGSADVWIVDPQCVGLRISGYLDLATVKKVVGLMNDAVVEAKSGVKFVAFCDYSGLRGADADGRELLQNTVKGYKEKFEMIHYLVPTKLIALAVQVAGLWHGIPTKTWTSRARIELEFVRVEALAAK